MTATGTYALTLDNSRNILAASSSFRGLLGVSTIAEAKALTWWEITDDIGEYLQAAMPRAIVKYSGAFSFHRTSTTGWTFDVPISVLIEVATPEQYIDDIQSGAMWFANQVSNMVDELRSLTTGGAADTLNSPNTFISLQDIAIIDQGRGDAENSPDGKPYFVACLSLECRGI